MPVQGDLIDAKISNIAPEQVSRFFLFDGELSSGIRNPTDRG